MKKEEKNTGTTPNLSVVVAPKSDECSGQFRRGKVLGLTCTHAEQCYRILFCLEIFREPHKRGTEEYTVQK
jgi:hypothetical protein